MEGDGLEPGREHRLALLGRVAADGQVGLGCSHLPGDRRIGCRQRSCDWAAQRHLHRGASPPAGAGMVNRCTGAAVTQRAANHLTDERGTLMPAA